MKLSSPMTDKDSSKNYISIRNTVFYRGERAIFADIDLDIPKRKISAIMGPSGTGKTTLLRLIGGQLKPDSGEIIVNNQQINKLSRDELFLARREMGLMFQSNALFTGLSVFENVAFPLRVHTDFTEQMINDVVLMKLEAVGLRGAAQLMPSELSGGMSRRVALARATVLDPKLMMYDEPFTGQDPISLGILLQLIKELNTNLQMTTVIVTHDVTEVLQIADYVFIIDGGKVIGEGTPEEMRTSEQADIKQFIKGLPDGPVPFQYPAEDYATELLEGSK